MSNVILALSGGIDSTTLLALAMCSESDIKVRCVFFNYGSKHNNYERRAVVAVGSHYKQNLLEINLEDAFYHIESNLLQSGQDIPEGHYNDPAMKLTVVPGRNLIFAAVLAGVAQSQFPDENTDVWLGMHKGDAAIYPDCRSAWVNTVHAALMLQSEGKVSFSAPFINKNKIEIVQTGIFLDVPFQKTRTCYKEEIIACGKCGACVERREAFQLNGVNDPIHYANNEQ